MFYLKYIHIILIISGIDFNSLLEENSKAEEHEDVARKAKIFEKLITHCQVAMTYTILIHV